jgi:hypothetical protein
MRFTVSLNIPSVSLVMTIIYLAYRKGLLCFNKFVEDVDLIKAPILSINHHDQTTKIHGKNIWTGHGTSYLRAYPYRGDKHMA